MNAWILILVAPFVLSTFVAITACMLASRADDALKDPDPAYIPREAAYACSTHNTKSPYSDSLNVRD